MREEVAVMALYSLDGIRVETPPQGEFWVAESATVVGKVRLARDSSVWFGAVIRGDNEMIAIGPRTNVQDHAVLHTDPGFPMTIGEGCTIGHQAIVHGATIGENVLVGMGAILMNGCKVGDNCLIAAHALIPEGKEIGAGSLVVGAPGKVIRKLKPEEVEGLKNAADVYNRRWRQYCRSFERQAP
jgi:carbonic anhydrase/acetyltransferase-like protein (isoleucine patch superfamily)